MLTFYKNLSDWDKFTYGCIGLTAVAIIAMYIGMSYIAGYPLFL